MKNLHLKLCSTSVLCFLSVGMALIPSEVGAADERKEDPAITSRRVQQALDAEKYQQAQQQRATKLILDNAAIDETHRRAFFDAIKTGRKFCNLETLSMKKCGITVGDLKALREACEAEAFPNLQHLHLDNNEIGNPGIEEIAGMLNSGKMARIKTITLNKNCIKGGLLLLEGPLEKRKAPLLEILDVRESEVDGVSGDSLVKASWHTKIQHLQLADNVLEFAGIRSIVEDRLCVNPSLRSSLTIIDLRNSRIGACGELIGTLLTHPSMAGLQELLLNGNAIDKPWMDGFVTVFKEKKAPSLKYLGLDINDGDLLDSLLEILKSTKQMPSLSLLRLGEKVNENMEKALKKAGFVKAESQWEKLYNDLLTEEEGRFTGIQRFGKWLTRSAHKAIREGYVHTIREAKSGLYVRPSFFGWLGKDSIAVRELTNHYPAPPAPKS